MPFYFLHINPDLYVSHSFVAFSSLSLDTSCVFPPLSVSRSLFSVHFAACAQTCLLSACLPCSQQVWGLYLITTRLNSLRRWRLIWRGGPGLSLSDPVPNTITPLFRYPAAFYNFAIFQCQGWAFWRVFIEFPAGPCCWGFFFLQPSLPPRFLPENLAFSPVLLLYFPFCLNAYF